MPYSTLVLEYMSSIRYSSIPYDGLDHRRGSGDYTDLGRDNLGVGWNKVGPEDIPRPLARMIKRVTISRQVLLI